MAPSTKLALANALKAQLQKKFLDDITVKELVEACEINRQTFYYHFQDIYDLLRWLLEHETAEALGGAEDWQAALLDAFCYIRDNHMVIYHIYRSAGRDNLLDCPFYSLARSGSCSICRRQTVSICWKAAPSSRPWRCRAIFPWMNGSERNWQRPSCGWMKRRSSAVCLAVRG